MKRIFLGVIFAVGLCSQLFAQTEVVTNGGFEFGVSGWQGLAPGATLSTNSPHSGAACLSISTLPGTQEVYQSITVPTNALAATLTYFYNIFSADGLHFVVNSTLGAFIGTSVSNQLVTVDTKNNTNFDPIEGTWHQVTFDLTPFVQTNGGHLQIQFLVTSSTTGGTLFNLDDVSLQVVDASARGANDNFVNATVLSGTALSVVATNTFATKEPGEPNHARNAGGKSLWWHWTSPGSGIVTISTAGSDFDTLLAAYTGSVVSNLTLVLANDNVDSARDLTSRIRFPVNPGAEYDIAVDGKDGASGTIVLNLNFATDTAGPSVSFTSPASGATVTNPIVTVQGTAKDNVGVALIEYRLENASGTNDYQPADGTNHWSATVTNLIPGLNTVRVRASDTSTNITTVARAFYYDIFVPAKGAYAGLFTPTSAVTATNAGFFTATLAAKGKFSAKLLLAGRSYALSGQFGSDSNFSKALPRSGQEPLTVRLTVDLAGGDVITGSVSNSAFLAPLSANRAVFSRAHPAPQGPKKYTLVIQASEDPASLPGGFGFGTAKVDVSANISFSGTLGDGTKVSQRTFLSKDGAWPFFLSPYAGKGVVTGWLTFTNDALSDFSGMVNWTKLPQKGRFYPNGFDFTNGVGVVGSTYSFTNGVPLLSLPNGGFVHLEGGNLSQPLDYPFSLDDRNKITGTNKLSLTISTASGLFRGSVPSGTTKPISVSGVLLQSQNAGFGVFLGTNQTGRVDLGQ